MRKECFKCKYRKLDKEFNYEQVTCKRKSCIYDDIENSLNEELDSRKKYKFNGSRWL